MAAYDPIAAIYDRYWGPFARRRFAPFLAQQVLPRLPSGARLLDLGCGTGQIAAWLVEQGYRVVGVDLSEAMIRHARQRAPRAHFVVQDMRHLSVSGPFDAAFALFATLNHLPDDRALRRVFRRVYAALAPGGWFGFDVNTAAGFRQRWQSTETVVEDDFVLVSRGQYDPQTRTARTRITAFVPGPQGWTRVDTELHHWPHEVAATRAALQAAGFAVPEVHEHASGPGAGRAFFLAQKPPAA